MNLDVSRSREYACKLVYLKERKREKLALASFRVLHKCSKIFRLDTETRYPSSFSHILIPWQIAQTSFQDTLWSFNFPQSSYSCSEFRPRWHSTRVARLLLGNVIQLNRSSTSVLYLMPFVHCSPFSIFQRFHTFQISYQSQSPVLESVSPLPSPA